MNCHRGDNEHGEKAAERTILLAFFLLYTIMYVSRRRWLRIYSFAPPGILISMLPSRLVILLEICLFFFFPKPFGTMF